MRPWLTRSVALVAIVGAGFLPLGLARGSALANGSGHHFGPYVTTNDPDSSTCGTDWATDSFKRQFQVTDNGNGTFTVEEDFVDGQFTTPAPADDPYAGNASPGACQTGQHGTIVAPGVSGHFHGFEVGTVTSSTFNSGACTPTTCNTTNGFITTVFGAETYTCYVGGACSFFFKYEAPSKGLIYKTWQNASPDEGGNVGDIASS